MDQQDCKLGPEQLLDIQRKIGEISLAMSDGYIFVKVRFFLEEVAQKALQGDALACQMLEHFEIFHRTCKHFTDN